MRERLISLQILRFAAAAAVVTMHAAHVARVQEGLGEAPYYPTDIGAAGVDVFFVLSGFVIARTGPLATPKPSGARFFWRRWSRVAPLFYLLSAPVFALALVAGRANAAQTVATFLFWPVTGGRIVQPYLAAGWTLGFEMLFYTTVSLVLAGGRLRRNLAALATMLIALVMARANLDWPPLRILANAIFLEFAAGVALALAWPRLRRAPVGLGLGLIAAGLAAFAVQAVAGAGDAIAWQTVLFDTDALRRVLVFGLPAAGLVAGALICEPLARGRLARAAAWLGDASYSTYLVQGLTIPPLATLWARLVGRGAPVAEAVAVIALTLAAGSVCYLVLEHPILRALRRLGGPRRRETAPAAA